MVTFFLVLAFSCLLCAPSFRTASGHAATIGTIRAPLPGDGTKRPVTRWLAESHLCRQAEYPRNGRAICDEKLWQITKNVLRGRIPALLTSIEDIDFKEAWRCYAFDICYMIPPGPTSVDLKVDETSVTVSLRAGRRNSSSEASIRLPIENEKKGERFWRGKAGHLTWYSYQQWFSAMSTALSEAVAAAGTKPIYLATHVGSPGGGVSGRDDNLLNRTLATYSQFFYKSELWCLIHAIKMLAHKPQIKGVWWLGGIGEAIPSGQLPKGSAVILPFDASYSGQQIEDTTTEVIPRFPKDVDFYEVVGIAARDIYRVRGRFSKDAQTDEARAKARAKARALDLLAADLKGAAFWVRRPRHAAIVGHLERSGGYFAPQFKLPDEFSMDKQLNRLLQCALCCTGGAVKREPYKFFYTRTLSKLRCAGLTPRKERFNFKCTCPLKMVLQDLKCLVPPCFDFMM